MHSFFSSPFWDFELTRILGSTAAGGCDTAEFLQAVGELRRHDPDSWYKAWIKQAEMVLNAGLEFEQAQLRTLARGCFLRAANYFRTAPYMLYGTGDERELKCSEQSAAAFDRATKYMNAKVLSLTIPFSDPAGESLDLPAYLMLPPELARPKKQRTPLIVVLGGADSALEEMYFFLGEAAPALGYAVLLFDGPGQGRVFKHFGTHLRPDYEVVVSAVLDRVWALAVERPDTNLDLTRIALVGASMGGYYALRSAAAEPGRVAAVVAIDPFLDMWEFALTRLPTWFANAWMAGWVPDSFLDWSCRFHMSIDFPTRWEFGTTLAAMGKSSPADLLREFQRYSLKGQVEVASNKNKRQNGSAKPAVRGGAHGGKIPILSSVECPVLLTGANTALYQSPEESTYRIAKLLVNVSEQHKEIWVPNTVGEGALTAKVGAWHALAGKLIAFLDRQLKTRQ